MPCAFIELREEDSFRLLDAGSFAGMSERARSEPESEAIGILGRVIVGLFTSENPGTKSFSTILAFGLFLGI